MQFHYSYSCCSTKIKNFHSFLFLLINWRFSQNMVGNHILLTNQSFSRLFWRSVFIGDLFLNEIKIFFTKISKWNRKFIILQKQMHGLKNRIKVARNVFIFLPSQNRKNYSKLSGSRLMQSLIDNVIIWQWRQIDQVP